MIKWSIFVSLSGWNLTERQLFTVGTSSDWLFSWDCDVLTLTHVQTCSWKQQEPKLSIYTTASLFRDPSTHRYLNQPFSQQARLMHSSCMRRLCLQSRGPVKGMKMWEMLNNKCSHWNAKSALFNQTHPSLFIQTSGDQFPFLLPWQTVEMICWLAEMLT